LAQTKSKPETRHTKIK